MISILHVYTCTNINMNIVASAFVMFLIDEKSIGFIMKSDLITTRSMIIKQAQKLSYLVVNPFQLICNERCFIGNGIKILKF